MALIGLIPIVQFYLGAADHEGTLFSYKLCFLSVMVLQLSGSSSAVRFSSSSVTVLPSGWRRHAADRKFQQQGGVHHRRGYRTGPSHDHHPVTDGSSVCHRQQVRGHITLLQYIRPHIFCPLLFSMFPHWRIKNAPLCRWHSALFTTETKLQTGQMN